MTTFNTMGQGTAYHSPLDRHSIGPATEDSEDLKITRFVKDLEEDRKENGQLSRHFKAQLEVRRGTRTRRMHNVHGGADMAGKAVQDVARVARAGAGIAKDISEGAEAAAAQDALKDAEASAKLFMLGVDALKARLVVKELNVMEETLEELQALRERCIDEEEREEIGEQIAHLREMIAQQKKMVKRATRKLGIKCVEIGFSTTEVALKEVLHHVPDLSQSDIDILEGTNAGLSSLSDVIYIGVKMGEIASNRKKVKALRQMHAEEVVKKGGETFKAAKLRATIHDLKEKQKNIGTTVVKRGLTFTCKLGERVSKFFQSATMIKTIDIGQKVLRGLSTAASSFILVNATVGLLFDTYSMVKHNKRYQQLRLDVTEIRADAADQEDNALQCILNAKAHRMKRAKRDMKAGFITKTTKLLSSAFSLIAATEAILVIAGVTFGTAASAAFAATGIGAMILGGVVIGLLIGNWLYKNRHQLSYYKDIWKTPFKRMVNNHRIRRVESARRKVIARHKKEAAAFNALTSHSHMVPELQLRLKQRKELTKLDRKVETFRASNRVLNKEKKMAKRVSRFKEMKSKMKNWNIEHFEQFELVVREKLENEEGKEEVRQLLATYNYTPPEEITFSHVFNFVINEEKTEKICDIDTVMA